jgi:choline dehydrogenase-like flavoprotein
MAEPGDIAGKEYDVVVIGSGVSGAIIVNELTKMLKGIRALVLDAGPGDDLTMGGYDSYMNRFYSAVFKGGNSPYGVNLNASTPVETDFRPLQYGQTDASGYVVQRGPVVLDGTYTRVTGGTTLHWQGNIPRMLPEDFEMRSRYGRGADWPFRYSDLMPYYDRAECELGASADVAEQEYHGVAFRPGYEFPMRKMPATYLDRIVAEGVEASSFVLDGAVYDLKVRGIPQARNGIPNPAYDGGAGYEPFGSVSAHQDETGMRCQGNTNCTPICPAQAKYDARRTMWKAMASGRVDFLPRAVASRVQIDAATGCVTGIEFKRYESPAAPAHTVGVARGRVYILAANAIENARLMLASGLSGKSGLVGRNLMNHVYLFAWGLMPRIAGAMRGTQGTSGIEELRGGAFRKDRAAFHIDIINNGWTYATGAPYSDLEEVVDGLNKFGRSLRVSLTDRVARQVLLAFMVDVPADANNRITVDGRYVDALGNWRPVASYALPDYSIAGAAFGREVSRRLFQRLGVKDSTKYSPLDYGYMFFNGEGLTLNGGNHFSGTHMMGLSPGASVVDAKQRSWEHRNLFLTGSGSMPSIGTSNPTLTLAALGMMTAEEIAKELAGSAIPVTSAGARGTEPSEAS